MKLARDFSSKYCEPKHIVPRNNWLKKTLQYSFIVYAHCGSSRKGQKRETTLKCFPSLRQFWCSIASFRVPYCMRNFCASSRSKLSFLFFRCTFNSGQHRSLQLLPAAATISLLLPFTTGLQCRLTFICPMSVSYQTPSDSEVVPSQRSGRLFIGWARAWRTFLRTKAAEVFKIYDGDDFPKLNTPPPPRRVPSPLPHIISYPPVSFLLAAGDSVPERIRRLSHTYLSFNW